MPEWSDGGSAVWAARSYAAALLRAAGIETAATDADWLLAHVLGVSRGEIVFRDALSPEQLLQFRRLVDRRAARHPLQHLTGIVGFRLLELRVGRGVFVPRPETEILVDHALRRLDEVRARGGHRRLRVVDLCSGSGAIALSIATERRDLDVVAVDVSGEACSWAEVNVGRCEAELDSAGSVVEVLCADVTDPSLVDQVAGLAGVGDRCVNGRLLGFADLVVANPPYIPVDAVPRDPEVRDHDPAIALFGGVDGLDVVRSVSESAALLATPGGRLLIEHGDLQGEAGPDASVPDLLRSDGHWTDVVDYPDLAGRSRVSGATRLS